METNLYFVQIETFPRTQRGRTTGCFLLSGKKFDPSIISVISYFKVFSYFWSNIKATLFKLKFIQINLPDLSNRKFNHFNKFHLVLIHQGKVNIIIMILTSWPWLGPRAGHGTGDWGWCRAPGCTGWCSVPGPPSVMSVMAASPGARGRPSPGDQWPPGGPLRLTSLGEPWGRSTRGRGQRRRRPGRGAGPRPPHWDTGGTRGLSCNSDESINNYLIIVSLMWEIWVTESMIIRLGTGHVCLALQSMMLPWLLGPAL